MSAREEELRRLLAELDRRPHLRRDPRVTRLIAQARELLKEDAPTPAPSRWRILPRFDVRGALQLGLDALVIAALLTAPLFVPSASIAAPSTSGIALAAGWVLLRAETARVLLVEAADAARRWVWHGILWFAEAFHPKPRRAWRRLQRANALARAWRGLPAEERASHSRFLAFLERELGLPFVEFGKLGEPPDWATIGGRIGRLENPTLRWHGDKRLLPSARFWLLLRAVRAAEGLAAPAAGTTEPPPAPADTPPAPTDTEAALARKQEADRIRSQIKAIEAEIEKIQRWNLTKPAEEEMRSALLREKRQAINDLRASLQKLASGGS